MATSMVLRASSWPALHSWAACWVNGRPTCAESAVEATRVRRSNRVCMVTVGWPNNNVAAQGNSFGSSLLSVQFKFDFGILHHEVHRGALTERTGGRTLPSPVRRSPVRQFRPDRSRPHRPHKGCGVGRCPLCCRTGHFQGLTAYGFAHTWWQAQCTQVVARMVI